MNILHAITLAALLHHAPATPTVTCHTGTVSYRFVGTPGATFTYAGAKYSVPPSGWIELLGDGGKVYLAANGRTLPLDVWPIDAFGTRTVPVQPPAAPAGDSSTPNTINN
ncbi:MAG TPA: hypothetical protein VGQ46_06160 [Thermoanaerobaculia bacterium]|jgi:hypothetical protein|nr:hypothetical protein [Thermoanaerobaculia bacterium]